MADVVLELPDALRSALKDPFGPIYADAEDLLADATAPVVAVGDVVTYHLLEAGHVPSVAFVDDRTERSAVDQEIRAAISGEPSDATGTSGDDGGESSGGFDREVAVDNPAGTLTGPLLTALRAGLDRGATTLVRVDGEEDLATLAAVLAVPEGASVVYGQPGEGMVLVTADRETRAAVRDVVERMDGDVDRALAAVAPDG